MFTQFWFWALVSFLTLVSEASRVRLGKILRMSTGDGNRERGEDTTGSGSDHRISTPSPVYFPAQIDFPSRPPAELDVDYTMLCDYDDSLEAASASIAFIMKGVGPKLSDPETSGDEELSEIAPWATDSELRKERTFPKGNSAFDPDPAADVNRKRSNSSSSEICSKEIVKIRGPVNDALSGRNTVSPKRLKLTTHRWSSSSLDDCICPPTPCPVNEGRSTPVSDDENTRDLESLHRIEETIRPWTPSLEGIQKRIHSPPKTPSPRCSVERSPPPPKKRVKSPSPPHRPPTPRVRSSSPDPVLLKGGLGVRKSGADSSAKVNSPIPGTSNQLVLYIPANVSHRGISRRSKDNLSLQHTTPEFRTPGAIKSLTMQNVMCYSAFEKKKPWSPTFNYIVGENGSGKSAILSSIVAALGGKALDTGRATNMKDIIRNGQTRAKIEIVLHDHPSKLYGEDIRIVRTLSRDGASRYQIRGADKRMRGLTRQELNLILCKLNIQVDNPLAILHQEMARNFIRTKDPSLLYNYFYRALLLNNCEASMNKALADLKTAGECLKQKRVLLAGLRSTQRDLTKQLETLDLMKNSRARFIELANRLIWAEVQDYEAAHKKVREELEHALKNLEEAKVQRDVVTQECQEGETNLTERNILLASSLALIINYLRVGKAETGGLDNLSMLPIPLEFRSFEERLEETNQMLTTKKEEYNKIRADMQLVRLNLMDVQRQLDNANRLIDNYGHSMKVAQERLDEHQRMANNDLEARMLAIMNAREPLLAEKGKLESQVLALKQVRPGLLTQRDNAVEEYDQQNVKVQRLRQKLDDARKELAVCKKSASMKHDEYGPEMAKLLEKIALENRWKKRPKGPLGCCISIKDENWVGLVEYILERSLNNFVVDNMADQGLLAQLIDQVYKTKNKSKGKIHKRLPSICMMTFGDEKIQVGNANASVEAGGPPSVLDVIQVLADDHVVHNWLIDIIRAERMLLFESYEDACDFLTTKEIPRTLKKAYSNDIYLFYPNPLKAIWQRENKPPRYLKLTEEQNNNALHISRLSTAITNYITEYTVEMGKYDQMRDAITFTGNQAEMNYAQIRELSFNINILQEQISKLDASSCTIADIALWVEEAQEAEHQKEENTVVKCQLEAQREQLLAQIDRNKELRMEEECKKFQQQLNTLLEQRNSTKIQLRSRRAELKTKESEVGRQARIAGAMKRKWGKIEKTLEKKTKEASAICPRIHPQGYRTAAEIESEIEALKAQLVENKGKIVRKDDITRQKENTKAEADRIEREIYIMDVLIGLAQPKIKLQRNFFQEKLVEYAIAIRTCFRLLIQSRGYQGDLVINHDSKTLTCYVSMDRSGKLQGRKNIGREYQTGKEILTNKKGAMEYASGMSGGERSFTTICFLVACWQLMDVPFYILDEFDVFMDTFNRLKSQNILMSVAQSKPFAQFFVFTPLPLEGAVPMGCQVMKLTKGKSRAEVGKDQLRIKGG